MAGIEPDAQRSFSQCTFARRISRVRSMSWLTVLVIALALVTLATWAYFFHARDAFWELAAKYADLAIALIALERDCVVGNMPPDGRKRDFAGPFVLIDTMGQSHSVYIHRAHLQEVRARLARKINGATASHISETRFATTPAGASDPGTRSRVRKRGIWA